MLNGQGVRHPALSAVRTRPGCWDTLPCPCARAPGDARGPVRTHRGQGVSAVGKLPDCWEGRVSDTLPAQQPAPCRGLLAYP
jgi:hypothetical protein